MIFSWIANLIQINRTGYLKARDKLRTLFSDDIVDKTTEIWGLNSECEINGVFRPSGYPGVSIVILLMKSFRIVNKL